MREDQQKELVEVPSLRKQRFLGAVVGASIDRTLPKRTIELRMSEFEAIRDLKISIFCGFLLMMFLYVAHAQMLVGPTPRCTSRGEYWVTEYPCPAYLYALGYLGLYGLPAALGVATLSSFQSYRRASGVFRRASKIDGPHVRVTRDDFWCERLLEPVRFEDVIEAQVIDGPVGRGPRIERVDLLLRRPPALAYGALETLSTAGGTLYWFRFSGMPYKNNDGLVHTIGFLADRRKDNTIASSTNF